MGRRRRAVTDARPALRGFTLVELLAVLVIFGLLAAIALPNLGIRSSRMLDEEARRLASSLEFARQRAVMTGVPHRVLVDLDQAAYRIEWQGRPEGEEALAAEAGGVALGAAALSKPALAPPAVTERDFGPLAGSLGDVAELDEAVSFAGIETAEGTFEQGTVQIYFERNGTSDPAAVSLESESGRRVVLYVAPLSDAVRFEYVDAP
jgi:type II secretion system protein H